MIREKVGRCAVISIDSFKCSDREPWADRYFVHSGTITDYIQMERPERDQPPQDDPDYWRAYQTLPIAEFFESWKENYRTLEWVVVPDNVDDGVMIRHDKETDVRLRHVYGQYQRLLTYFACRRFETYIEPMAGHPRSLASNAERHCRSGTSAPSFD